MKTTYKGKLYYSTIDHSDHYDIDFIFYSRSQIYMTLDHVNRNENLEFRGDRSCVTYDDEGNLLTGEFHFTDGKGDRMTLYASTDSGRMYGEWFDFKEKTTWLITVDVDKEEYCTNRIWVYSK